MEASLRGVSTKLNAGVRSDAAEGPIDRRRARRASALSELFAPLDRLLGTGGDPRLSVDPASATNEYGCRLSPCPNVPSFASSTATAISERAYDHAGRARQSLMRCAVAHGMDDAFDARMEAMRDELKAALGLSPAAAEVIFSPSGTDSQLHALLLVQALLGPALTSVVVAADQTGSGTAQTARGHHFSTATATGSRVLKGEPIAGPARSVASVGIGLFDERGDWRAEAETDAMVLGAIEASVANGTSVLLQIMDCSKLGWRAPSGQCLDEIAVRWPDRVQVVVDACQTRLGRPRLRKYLDRGYLVIVTGSKFFTGPAFSGALLVPASLAGAVGASRGIAPGFRAYGSRSDWPAHWRALRSCFPVRANLGQWLRWEAALEEMRAYRAVPDRFRLQALTTFGQAVQRIMASSPSLRLLPPQRCTGDAGLDEELAQPTIFPFAIRHGDRDLTLAEGRTIYRALAVGAGDAANANGCATAAEPCLIGQPVVWQRGARQPAALLRLSAGARLVTETWSSDEATANRNLQRELGRVGAVVANIERLVSHLPGLTATELSHAN
jgi:hypothetical protein